MEILMVLLAFAGGPSAGKVSLMADLDTKMAAEKQEEPTPVDRPRAVRRGEPTVGLEGGLVLGTTHFVNESVWTVGVWGEAEIPFGDDPVYDFFGFAQVRHTEFADRFGDLAGDRFEDLSATTFLAGFGARGPISGSMDGVARLGAGVRRWDFDGEDEIVPTVSLQLGASWRVARGFSIEPAALVEFGMHVDEDVVGEHNAELEIFTGLSLSAVVRF